MIVVFLDFDGVLNSTAFQLSLPEEQRGGVMGLDRAAIVRLNRLVQETEAEVVISSTWRHGRTVQQLRTLLQEHGFVGTVRGRTPQWLEKSPGGLYSAEERGHEIQAWLNKAEDYGCFVDSFVILDDDSDMAHLRDRLIKTEFATGLLDEHVDRAIAMLRAPMPLILLPKPSVTEIYHV